MPPAGPPSLAQLRQDRGEQPRDLHLTDAQAMAGLLLGEVVDKTGSKDAPLADSQDLQGWLQSQDRVQQLERLLRVGQDVTEQLTRVAKGAVQ